jgi:hypothetical protein
MKIRSVTVHADLEHHDWDELASFLGAARKYYDVEVQTVRASTVPQNGRFDDASSALDVARQYDDWAASTLIDYVGGFGLGRYPSRDELSFIEWVPEILSHTSRVFSNCQIAWGDAINLRASRECARTVRALSSVEDGFANLRFAGLYNCMPDNPFFPTSYASGDVPNFSLALEAADLALDAFTSCESLNEARDALLSLVRDRYCSLLSTSLALEEEFGIAFYGADFTLAPAPTERNSIARALEELGITRFGGHGTLFLSAFLADAIKSLGGNVGFSGLMYPVLEDAGIASRVGDGSLSIESLMLYSAVCGTGLDCIPLPASLGEDDLNAIMLDIAGLSARLHKPLTTRLFPLADKKAGEMTEFDFPYFSNAAIMGTKDGGLRAFDDDELRFTSHKKR